VPAAGAVAFAAHLEVTVVSGLDVGDMEETVTAHAKIDEGRLDARLNVDDAPLVDVADVAFVAGPFHVQFFQHAVFEDGNATFLGLQDVDEHFFLHAFPFRDGE
jgi:hypothetical protein